MLLEICLYIEKRITYASTYVCVVYKHSALNILFAFLLAVFQINRPRSGPYWTACNKVGSAASICRCSN